MVSFLNFVIKILVRLEFIKSFKYYLLFFLIVFALFSSFVLAQPINYSNNSTSLITFHLSVVDAINHPVNKAIIKIDCPNNSIPNKLFYTDAMGDLYLDVVSSSDCLLRVAYGDYFFKSRIELSSFNSSYVVKFKNLNKRSYWWFWLILIFLILMGLFIFRKKYISNKFYLSSSLDTSSFSFNSNKLSKSSNKISYFNNKLIGVLNPKEKLVINYLIKNFQESNQFSNSSSLISLDSFYLSQSNIIFGTSIPKTSLVRVFSSLESKGLIKIKKIGKAKRIYLTSKLLKN